MHVDFKITTWERIEIPEEHQSEVLDKIKKGIISIPQDVCEEIGHDETEMLNDYKEEITIEENDGQRTIEVYDDNYQLIHQNGKNPKL